MSRPVIIGILLFLHSLMHLLVFLISWDLIDIDGISRSPTVFAEDIPIGVLRDLGALWLLGFVSFTIAGYGAMTGRRWWKGLTLGSTIVSLIASVFWIHEVWPGTVLNAVIIVVIIRSWQANDLHWSEGESRS